MEDFSLYNSGFYDSFLLFYGEISAELRKKWSKLEWSANANRVSGHAVVHNPVINL